MVNTYADFTIIAESPITAAKVWINNPQQEPSKVCKPPFLLTVSVFFVAIAVFGPGKIINKMHINKKTDMFTTLTPLFSQKIIKIILT